MFETNLCYSKYIRFDLWAEVALGRKTGEHRSLAEAPDRETKMTLPSPLPIGIFGPLYSVCAIFKNVCAFIYAFG